MKILMVHNYYQQRGGEYQVFHDECLLLKAHGHDVITYTRHNDEIKEYSLWRKAWLAKQTVWATDSVADLQALLQKEKPDIVHFHNTFPLISPAVYHVCQKMDIPVVQTLHNYRLLCVGATFYRDNRVCEECLGKRVPLPGFVNRCYRGSWLQSGVVAGMLTFHRVIRTWQELVDAYIVLTAFSREKFIEGGIPAEKIVVKPNFLYPDPDPDHIKTAEEDYYVFVGRFAPEKGIYVLINAWQIIASLPLRMVGDGPLLEETRKKVKEDKTACIKIMGRQTHEKTLELIQQAKALIIPSRWYEGFPKVILEALAAGVPVIASNLGSLGELVEGKGVGLTFPPGDHEALARVVKWFHEHTEEIERMKEKACQTYQGEYNSENNYQQLIKIYQDVVNAKCSHASNQEVI
jgi:glycosyltransferase involved in cell wall biosynthesis